MTAETTPPDAQALLQRLDAQYAEIQRLRALVEPDAEAQPRTRSRRDLLKLAGAAVVAAAGATAMRVVPASAANGDPVLVGGTYTGTQGTQITNTIVTNFAAILTGLYAGVMGTMDGVGSAGVFGRTDLGNAVYGLVNSSGAGSGNGVYGQSANTTGVGVKGVGSGTAAIGGYFVGMRAPLTLQPAALSGPPTSNAHSLGDIWSDAGGILWICIVAGTPGVFAPLQTGGANLTHFVKVSNKQYALAYSDGATWVDMDATGLAQVITPMFNAQAVISISADLWTANAGFNQDLGIFISGGAYGAGQIVAWKESGGFAGTFSPNAAFVETTQPMVAGTAYTIKVRWKTNVPASGATIFAGAGPLAPGSAGGGVAGQYSPTRLATHLVVDVPSPITLHIPANDPTQTPPPVPPLPRK